MSEIPTIEDLDIGLKDEVWQVFNSNLKPFKSARELYFQRRSFWVRELRSVYTLTVTVRTPTEGLKSITLSRNGTLSAFASAISIDEDLIRIVKTDGLESFNIDNEKLARIFAIHIFAGEPYLTKRK